MTSESQLASLLIQMGRERGVAIERVVDDLAQVTLPPFVDPQALRHALIDAAEAYWHAELDERVRRLRQQFGVDGAAPPRPPVAATERPVRPPLEPVPMPPSPPVDAPDATMHEPAVAPAPADTMLEVEEGPHDATMIWTTRRE